MTDNELDELLDIWTVPPPPVSLREGVRAGFVRPPRRRKRMWVAAALAAAALVLVVAQARPSSPPVPAPYTVDSEFVLYAEDGSSLAEMRLTSYEFNGSEVLVSRSIPERPFRTAIGRALDVTLPVWSQLISRLTFDAATLARVRQSASRTLGVLAGCDASCLVLQHYGFARGPECMAGSVVGRESILGYPATAVRPQWGSGERMTVWTAPALGCFALRITTEAKRPDGTWRLLSEKRAVRVNLHSSPAK